MLIDSSAKVCKVVRKKKKQTKSKHEKRKIIVTKKESVSYTNMLKKKSEYKKSQNKWRLHD